MPNLDTRKAFGLVIKKYRLEAGLSQEELAELAGLHRTYVSLLERGQRNPSLEVILSLGKALKKSPGSLVNEVTK